MELIERAELLAFLHEQFNDVSKGEGHCVFVSGEAGIGKTSLVKLFCKQQKGNCNVYQGACDSLFTPRPLAPLHDIIWQIQSDLWPGGNVNHEKSELFSAFFQELSKQKETVLIVFEDIHWADEATLDFIKFLARRIAFLKCMFILTYRDDEIHSRHPLRNVLGQLPPDSFTKISLAPLSREAVDRMAAEKGYSGEDVYNISRGNPFYVSEILSSYSLGIPENIRDSILSTYNNLNIRTRQVWDLLSVIPSSFEVKYLEKFEPQYASDLEQCIEKRILFMKDGQIFFKHELFRRTIESSLSPLKRVALNKKILDLLKDSFEENNEIERIIHHAKNANEYDMVVKYTPIAASEAACVGAHIEASRLYITAIEYYQGNDKNTLISFYEAYAYECYLTNQIKEAIIYSGKALTLLKEQNNIEKTGNCMRFLSRLWWLDGNRNKAESFGLGAIKLLENEPSSPAKAMAFSNMSQLKMLFDLPYECISWGEKAIGIAKGINDDEALSHALNNVGSVYMNIPAFRKKGIEYLRESLNIALRECFDEHAARAYSNMASNALKLKDFAFAYKILEEGIVYCEKRDLDSWRSNMLSVKASVLFETGHWEKAYAIAEDLMKNEQQPPSYTIAALNVMGLFRIRRGIEDALPLLTRSIIKAFESMELQRIIPSVVSVLEYEWLSGERCIEDKQITEVISKLKLSDYNFENNEFAFWLLKARNQVFDIDETHEGYDVSSIIKARKAAAIWEKLNCPYRQALALYQGDEENKKQAISLLNELGAVAVYKKLKQEMRTSGIKGIPYGIRNSTRSNAAFLTDRELDVLQLLKEGLQNKEIAAKLFISAKTVDHHISSILFKLDVKTRNKAVSEAVKQEIIK